MLFVILFEKHFRVWESVRNGKYTLSCFQKVYFILGIKTPKIDCRDVELRKRAEIRERERWLARQSQ